MANKVGTYEMRPYEIAAVDRYLNRTAHAFRTDDKKYQKAISIDMANAVCCPIPVQRVYPEPCLTGLAPFVISHLYSICFTT